MSMDIDLDNMLEELQSLQLVGVARGTGILDIHEEQDDDFFIITRDYSHEWDVSHGYDSKPRVGYCSNSFLNYLHEFGDEINAGFVKSVILQKMPYKFRLYDDEGMLNLEGYCSNDSSFVPLDELGEPDMGCTEIYYFNHEKNKWELL